MALARSTEDLRQLAGGRSVYSEEQLHGFGATAGRPVKVINFLLVTHIAPVIELEVLQLIGVIGKPPQSIYSLTHEKIATLLDQILTLGFKVKQ
jgi:hypothetical protein